jgi:hypothetical protein
MRFGFVGPAYASPSPLAANEQLINWYPQKIESPNARVPFILLPTSGLSLFANLGNYPTGVRGSGTFNGRTFKVAGTHLIELTTNGVTDFGGFGGNNNIVDDGLPVTMVCGGTVGGNYPSQLLICSGGTLTVFSLVSNTFQALTTPPANVLMVDFLAGFFCALSSGNSWSVSAVEDATTWPGTAVSQVSIFSDQLLALIECNELIWLLGAKHAAAYYVSGAPLFPFDVTSGGVLNIGILAQFSATRIQTARGGRTLAWIGGDDKSGPTVYALNGYIPQRISDSALEYWLSHNTVTDAVGMFRQESGQNFFDLWFPTANATWTLDADLGMWHRRAYGVQGAHLQRSNTYNAALGGHLIGDRTSGKVFLLNDTNLTDNGAAIIRTRVGPTISNEGGQIPVGINEFQVDFEMGLGPQPPLKDAFGNPRDPLAMFSYSEDFGKTFGPERMIPCGQAGNFKAVAIDRRLGSWRSWTPKVTVSDPISWRIADAYVNGTQDQKERYAKSMARIA